MTFDVTRLIKKQEISPEPLPLSLQALWYDKRDWDKADRIVQNASDADNAWVHAYLHRKEGDLSSGRSEFKESVNQEWEQIVRNLLRKI
jgi:hypothetical protein